MHRRKICRSAHRFRFGDESFQSLGRISLPLATPPGVKPILVQFDIVQANIPPLLRMNVLDREKLVADTVFNRLARRSANELEDGRMTYVGKGFIPLVRSLSRHVYVPLDCGTRKYLTKAQLHKLHSQLFYLSPTKLFNLLRKAHPEDATPETLHILRDISKRCDPCQRFKLGPIRFRVSFGNENARFDERIMMDIMYIEMK